MHGSRRVITFCLLTTVLPTILIVLPLYLRNIKYADVMYKISDSDVIQIHKGQSSVFCQKHSLKMNSTFSAFQMKGTPEISDKRKHIKLKKSMTLPDDTLEYWGFYLLIGATVELKACSRHKGSKILVVKGDRILDTCGILEGYKHKKKLPRVENNGLLVTLEKPRETNKINISNIISDMDDSQDNSSESIEDTKDNNHSLENTDRSKRDIKNLPLHNPNTILDTGVHHGGNAINSTMKPQEPISSFENSLHECYHDKILINHLFPYSIQCNSTDYLEKTTILKVIHEVLDDGYYYYIFYGDQRVNDIYAIFDIYKPTFQYVNNSESKVCFNKTECEFNIDFFSDELVIVEKPTKEGLQNEESDSSILISVCHPRVSIYIIFPISVLLLILLFAFL
ncbi:uncharacterized protein LOC142987505 isoform X2 [Anticarsia gemmatalis]